MLTVVGDSNCPADVALLPRFVLQLPLQLLLLCRTWLEHHGMGSILKRTCCCVCSNCCSLSCLAPAALLQLPQRMLLQGCCCAAAAG
jgi:hypothetical protein